MQSPTSELFRLPPSYFRDVAPGGTYGCPLADCAWTVAVPHPSAGHGELTPDAPLVLTWTGVSTEAVKRVLAEHLVAHSPSEILAGFARLLAGPDPDRVAPGDQYQNLDHLTREQLAASYPAAAAAAEALDEVLHRLHGITTSAHGAGLLLDLLDDHGFRVVPVLS